MSGLTEYLNIILEHITNVIVGKSIGNAGLMENLEEECVSDS